MGEESGFRIEHDTMGEVQVPADALWRAQTQRAVENFPISGRGPGACPDQGAWPGQGGRRAREQGHRRARRVHRGRHRRRGRRGRRRRARRALPHRRLPDRLGHQLQHERQRGDRDAGRARRGRRVHPNDHVNASQSSNDVFPTTIHLAATEALATDVVPALEHLAAALRRRAADWADVVTAGPHPPHGRRADHARPGGGRLGHAGRVRRGPGPRRAPPAGAARHRRHGRRHRA